MNMRAGDPLQQVLPEVMKDLFGQIHLNGRHETATHELNGNAVNAGSVVHANVLVVAEAVSG